MKFRNYVATFLLLAGAQQAFAFGAPRHSSVAVETKADGDKLRFDFKVNVNEGMKITFDAPWSLEIKAHEGLAFTKTKLSKDEMNEKLPGFSVTTNAKPTAAKGEVEYRLMSFICTRDKTQCFPEVHKGKASWAKAE